MFDAQHLQEALAGLGVGHPDNLFDELAAAYQEPTRFYHNRAHISDCLAQLQRYRTFAHFPHEVEIAIWFHDAVYDTRRGDNEEKSAAWAQQSLTELTVNPESIRRITQMIIATKTHEASDPDTQLLLDIDLSILGATREVFERYDQAIRKEYEWVPLVNYRAVRRKVLSSFLERPAIFLTHPFHRLLESSARENIQRKIAELGA